MDRDDWIVYCFYKQGGLGMYMRVCGVIVQFLKDNNRQFCPYHEISLECH